MTTRLAHRLSRPRSRAGGGILKKLLIVLAILFLLLVVFIALLPTIASKFAPGIIESAAADSIKGSVKVESVRLGWSGPTVVGPVELRDDTGKPVGRVRIEVPVGLMGAIALATGDLTNIDIGEVKVDGRLDVVRNADGTMNLSKAVEPRNPPTAPAPSPGASSGSSPIDKIKAKLTVTDLDVTYKDLGAAPGSPTAAIGVDSFAGSADIDYAAKAGTADVNGAFAAKVQSGAAVGAGGTSGDDLKLNMLVKASGLPTAGTSGPLNPSINADIGISGVPITLIDALTGFGGELAASIGDKADAAIKANGTRDNATAALNLSAPGAGADLDLAYDGVAVTATRPGRLWTRSTQFIAGLQAAKAPLADIGRSVQLDAAPGIDIALDALRLPLPKSALDAFDLKSLDLRAAQARLSIKADAMTGRVALEPPAPPTAPAPAVGTMKPFRIEPATVRLVIDDLAKGAAITAASSATIDAQSAGELAVAITAGGLLDAHGRLKALGDAGAQAIPSELDADIRIDGLATALVSPVLAGLNFPVDLREDVGPTLDVAIAAQTIGPAPATPQPAPGAPAPTGAGGLAAVPPMNVAASVTSANIRLDAPVRIQGGMVTVAEKPAELTINRAGPIARRILAEQATSAPAGSTPMKLDGSVRVHALVKDFSAPLDPTQLDPAKLRGAIDLTVEDAAVTLPAAPGATPAPPIAAQKLTTRVTLSPQGPRAVVNGAMSHAGAPFTVDADLSAPGFAEQFPKAKNGAGAALADILAYRPTGTLALKGVPASLTALAPDLDKLLNAAPVAGDVKSQVFALARSLVGKSVDMSASLAPTSAAENAVTANVKAPGVSADLAATLKPAEIAVSRAVVSAPLQPRQLDGLLDALLPVPVVSVPAPGTAGPAQPPGAAGAGGPPVRLRDPITVNASLDPLVVPMKPDSLAPDLAKVQRVIARASAPSTVIIDNLILGTRPDGSAKRQTVAVRGLKLAVDAPGRALSGDNTAHVTLYADAELFRGHASGIQPLTTLKAKAVASPDTTKPIDASVTLGDIDFASVDALAGTGDGLIPGLVGASGNVWISAKGVPNAANPDMRVELSTETQRIKFTRIKLDAKQGALRLVEPTTILVRPDTPVLSRAIFPPDAAGAPSPTLDGIAAIEITLNQLAAAIPDAQKNTGPIKPGVFALDAGVTIPSLRVNTPVADAPGAPAKMLPVTLEGVRLAAKSGDAGSVALNAVIDRVSGQGSSSNDKATLRATVRQIADAAGNLTTDKAILDAQADVKGFPSVLIDALANQKGILAEALGPTANLTATATGLSAGGTGGTGGAGGGSLTAQASSQRAQASVAGTIRNKTFVTTAPLDVKLVEITPRLVEELAGALPLVGSAEKTRQDEPATVKSENLTVPLDGNLRNLNGRVAVTPGVMRYTTAGFFQKVLKLGELRDTGSVGKRIEPFVVNLKNGVATYDKFRLPIGEFKFETSGSLDLVDRTIDIVTYVPFFAVTDEIAGALNTGLGKLLGGILPGAFDRATMIPIRTRGSMDNPKVEPDIQLFFKENADALKQAPGKLLEGDIGDKLKDLLPGGLPLPGRKDGDKPPR